MRTTIDLDDRVLAGARSRARTRGITVGQAVSELALLGYEAEEHAAVPISGGAFPMLSPVPGHVITDEMVQAIAAPAEHRADPGGRSGAGDGHNADEDRCPPW